MSGKRIASRAATITLFGVFPSLTLVGLVALSVANGRHGTDFHTFWQSGRDVLHGRSPYPSLSSLPRHANPQTFAPFVYPPVAAFSMAPLSLLPFGVAKIVFLALDLAAVGLALRLLGVLDWRCYAVAFASVPVYAATALGTVSPLLLLGVAAAWRYRERAGAAGLLVAYVITAKLFLWPLWLWLVRTRRFRAAAVAAVASVVAVAGSWAAIGFAGLREYPRLLGRLTELVGPRSYSPYALGRAVGLSGGTSQLVVYAVAALALCAAALFVKGDRRVLVAAVGIALLATPIVWPHYFVLLFLPIALVRRTLSPLWAAPLLFWLRYSPWSHESTPRILGVFAIVALIGVVTLRRGSAAAWSAEPLAARVGIVGRHPHPR
jgi:hypothetical protein